MGSLGIVASSASANPAGTSQEIPVTLAGPIATICNIGAITAAGPGTLASTDGGVTLETATPGLIADISCNTDHSVTVGTPSQQVAAVLPGQTLVNPVYTAKVTDPLGNIAEMNGAVPLPLPLVGLTTLRVEMTAKEQDDSVLKAGNYEFEVPVTITCN